MIKMLGVFAVNLFDYEIDKDKTADRVDRFLDKKFFAIRNTAGATASDLSSPLLDKSGVVNHSHVNNADMRFLGYAGQYKEIEACQHVVQAVMKTIEACPNNSRQPYASILYKRYIKYDFDINVYNSLGYSKSRYYQFKKDALTVFAQIFPSKMAEFAENDLEYNLVPDLIVKSKIGHFSDKK